MCRLHLASLFCCGCMLLLIFIFTWNPLKEKIPGEQVSRGLLSWDCEKLFQFIPKEKLLLSTGVGWRVLEESSLDCFGDGDGLIFVFLSNSGGGVPTFRYCWWHCKHFIFITRIICIKSTFRAVTGDVFYFTFISDVFYFTVFEQLFFLQSGLLLFHLRTILLMVTFFHSAQHCVYCIDPHGLIFIPNIS